MTITTNMSIIPSGFRNSTPEICQKYFSDLAKHRHKPDQEAKKIVQEEWLKQPFRFGSATDAAEYFADWLVNRKQARRYKPRTVCTWISQCARENGIRWR